MRRAGSCILSSSWRIGLFPKEHPTRSHKKGVAVGKLRMGMQDRGSAQCRIVCLREQISDSVRIVSKLGTYQPFGSNSRTPCNVLAEDTCIYEKLLPNASRLRCHYDGFSVGIQQLKFIPSFLIDF